jgi:DivIVA domain-containing protein
MDSSPQLLNNIQFAEVRRGYDRDQVDEFLRELSLKVSELQDLLHEATRRAEVAEGRANEATEARDDAEARLRSAGYAPGDGDLAAINEVDAAAGILGLAQKTADAALAEAELKAEAALADARAQAAQLVVDAEREVEGFRAEAEASAEQLAAAKLADLEREVERLTSVRDGLGRDADILRAYAASQRDQLRVVVDTLTQVMDDPGGLLLAPAPVLEITLPEAAPQDDLGPPPGEETLDTTAADPATDPDPDADADLGPMIVAGTGESSTWSSAGSTVTDTVDTLFASDDEAISAPPIDLRTDLFGDPEPGGAPPKPLFEVLPDDSGVAAAPADRPSPPPGPRSSLGEPDADADAAMRAFFDQDQPEESPNPQKGGRFLRRK